MSRLGQHSCACKRQKCNSDMLVGPGVGWCQQSVLNSGLLTSSWLRVPFHLCAWNFSMSLAFSGHLSSGCHSGNLIASNKKSSALPGDFHGGTEHRLWPGSGPISSPEPSIVAMGEMFLSSRPTWYAVFGSLSETGQVNPELQVSVGWKGHLQENLCLVQSRADDEQPKLISAPCACQTVSSHANKQTKKTKTDKPKKT